MLKEMLVLLVKDAIECYKIQIKSLSDRRAIQIKQLQYLSQVLKTEIMLKSWLKSLIEEIESVPFFAFRYFRTQPSRFAALLKSVLVEYDKLEKQYQLERENQINIQYHCAPMLEATVREVEQITDLPPNAVIREEAHLLAQNSALTY